jgi:hypothetical protein
MFLSVLYCLRGRGCESWREVLWSSLRIRYRVLNIALDIAALFFDAVPDSSSPWTLLYSFVFGVESHNSAYTASLAGQQTSKKEVIESKWLSIGAD